MNYVFDFGSLNTEDEMKYVENMLKQKIKDVPFLNKAIKCIIKSQNWIRDETNEVCNVSLRDIRRFIITYEWFIKTIGLRTIKYSIKNENFENMCQYYKVKPYFDPQSQNKTDITESSIVLSLILGYYMRLSVKENRQKYLSLLAEWLDTNVNKLEEILKREQIDIFCRFKCPEGIAPNKALLENLFTIFVCVINKIPVFICGKPGCSKTLSIQILYSSMRGADSFDEFLKSLPRIYMNSYQGSMTSTSEGILRVFQKAKDLLKKDDKNMKNLEELLSLVFIDELGLAEISPSNPVKVIHSELEIDQQEEQVSFVGVSNWTLDASKMNRGVFLARPDPDEEDLIETSKIIAESIRKGLLNKYEIFFINLAKTYQKYKDHLSKKLQEKQDFHGTRDFYNLIKQCAREVKNSANLTEQELFDLGCKGLERNFGGFPDSTYIAKKFFLETSDMLSLENIYVSKSYNILAAVEENLRDPHSRYLMIITKSSLSIYLLQFIMDNINKKFNIFTGSQFGDQMKEDYSFKMLNKIMVSMEQGQLLVLNNLEFIYPSLYDVFNSNFSTVGGKKFTRIALGTTNNPLAPVHEDFRFVIIISSNDIAKQDPPFLQRFEKHVLSFEDLLTENEKQLGENFDFMINEEKKSKYMIDC